MRILAISDVEARFLWDYFDKRRLDGVDMILSCGDLAPEYLSFLATFTAAPVLYVHGNHDDRYEANEPNNCICVENRIYTHQGVRVLGLGGSMRYKLEGRHQYSQFQMRLRTGKMALQLYRNRGFDILLTHAPGRDMVDCHDLAHMGFSVFNRLLDKYQPALFLHGHTHLNYGRTIQRESIYGATRVVNAYERYILEL